MPWLRTAIGLLSAVAFTSAPAHRAADVTLSVDLGAGRHAISPLIYGINDSAQSGAAFDALLADERPGLIRLGGNRWTAYNWENNDSNAGSDYQYQNDDYLSSSTTPGAAVLPTVEKATAAGAATMVTIPNVGYVAADRNADGDIRNSPNYLTTRLRQNVAAGGPMTLTPDTGDASVYQDQFAYWLEHSAPAGAKILFSLDNEPDLWSDTHPEVHPNPVSYAELVQRNTAFATALKSVWPGAPVTGPVNYGLAGYENLQNAPDAGAHGNFQTWYLGQMAAAATTVGHRLIDDLDVHYYTEAAGGSGRVTGTQTDPGSVAAREQAPRSLWDPNYVENSWITTDYWVGEAIRLIARLNDRIAAAYPGTKLAFTEWNFGGGQHISGAIATADALGIFGRQGVDAAAWWPLNDDNSYALAAFRAFRNYDGQGGAFGSTSVQATSSDLGTATVYASDDPPVVIAINKATTAKSAHLVLAHGPGATSAKVFTLTAAGAAPAAAAPLTAAAPDDFAYTMPAQSVSVIVPQGGAVATPTPTPTPTPTATPTPTPGRPLPKLGTLIRWPARCAKRLKVTVRPAARSRVRSVRARPGHRPRGAFTLRVTVTLKDGRTVRGSRRYPARARRCR